MQTENIGTIRYGEIKFNFNMTPSIKNFLLKNSLETQIIFPKTQFFYQGVLMKLKATNQEKKEIEIIINSIKSNENETKDEIKIEAEKFENFPIHTENTIYYLDFYAKIK